MTGNGGQTTKAVVKEALREILQELPSLRRTQDSWDAGGTERDGSETGVFLVGAYSQLSDQLTGPVRIQQY